MKQTILYTSDQENRFHLNIILETKVKQMYK